MTKDDPAIPIPNLTKHKPTKECTVPKSAVGMDARTKTAAMGKRAPTVSQAEPTTNLATTVEMSEQMVDNHTSCRERWSDSCMTPSSGEAANHMKLGSWLERGAMHSEARNKHTENVQTNNLQGRQKGHPRGMKGPHVRTLKRAEFDFLGSIILILVDAECIRSIRVIVAKITVA